MEGGGWLPKSPFSRFIQLRSMSFSQVLGLLLSQLLGNIVLPSYVAVAKDDMNPTESEETYDDDYYDDYLEFIPHPSMRRLLKKRSDEVVTVSLQPFYSFRKIVKGQRWKKSTDMFIPAFGFGKRSPTLQFII